MVCTLDSVIARTLEANALDHSRQTRTGCRGERLRLEVRFFGYPKKPGGPCLSIFMVACHPGGALHPNKLVMNDLTALKPCHSTTADSAPIIQQRASVLNPRPDFYFINPPISDQEFW